MRRSAVAVLSTIGVLLVAACSERDTTTPRLPGAANFAATLTPATTCDFTQISKAAKAYFTSAQDPVFTLISNMKQASGAARTTVGWQIMQQVATERLSAATGAASDGAIFVNDVLRCTTYSFPTTPPTATDVQQNFLDNLALVLSAGIFDVRDGANAPNGPVAAFDGSPRVLAQPRWGVEPVSSWPSGPILVWGYPILIGNAVVNAATNINTNGTGTYNGFELGTIPDATPKSGLRVGICYQSVNGNTANRLIHNNSEILVESDPSALCTATFTSASAWYLRALARAASLVAPATAHAMQGGFEIGGLPSSWSPISSAALLGANIGLAITPLPLNSRVGQNIHAVVTATINNIPVPGVDVTLSVDNNMGAPAGAIIIGGNPTITTGQDGTATFDFALGKPGGYLIAANGSLTGVTTGSTLSNQINIKQP